MCTFLCTTPALRKRGKVLKGMVGPGGLEPLTSSVSRKRSNQLSYGPMFSFQQVTTTASAGAGPNGSNREFTTRRCASRLLAINPCVYTSSVILLFA